MLKAGPLTSENFLCSFSGTSFQMPFITVCSKGDKVYTTSLSLIGTFPIVLRLSQSTSRLWSCAAIQTSTNNNPEVERCGPTDSHLEVVWTRRRDLRCAGRLCGDSDYS